MTLFETISVASGFLITFASVVAYGQNMLNKIENLTNASNNNIKAIDDIWRWKSSHEKDSFATRETLQKELARLEGHNMVTNEQFKQIMAMLTDIKIRMEKLEDNQRRKE